MILLHYVAHLRIQRGRQHAVASASACTPAAPLPRTSLTHYDDVASSEVKYMRTGRLNDTSTGEPTQVCDYATPDVYRRSQMLRRSRKEMRSSGGRPSLLVAAQRRCYEFNLTSKELLLYLRRKAFLCADRAA